jgi:uncharacterized damage-inducible protein DinB
MTKILPAILLVLTLAASAAAQDGTQPAPSFASWLKNAYTTNRQNILRSAAKVPEEFYGMRPGPQMEVRTFGQIIGHLANFNYLWCSQAKGEKNPKEGRDLEKLPSKAELTKALGDAFAYCDGGYGSLTDASAQRVVEITQENGGKARLNRVSLLVLNYGHNNEHYGNLVTYMRIKSIVPASSEPRQP